MNDENDAHLEHLQGRIIALELFMRGVLANFVAEDDDPEATIQRLRSEMIGSLQHVERPLNDAADRIWGHAADALHMQFDEVLNRLRNLPE